MRWPRKPYEPHRWRRAFAWFPLVVGDTWIWLEPYERRIREWDCLGDPIWERRLPSAREAAHG